MSACDTCVQDQQETVWVVRRFVVFMDTYKTSLLLAASGLICNSGWAADRVQRNITSVRKGEETVWRKDSSNEEEEDSMFPLLPTRTVRKLHITLHSFSRLIVPSFSPSLCSLYTYLSTPLYSFVSALYLLFCLLFYSSFHSCPLSPLQSSPPSFCSSSPDAVAQCDRWSWIR